LSEQRTLPAIQADTSHFYPRIPVGSD